ncbi:MAG TPA: hypothetical protein VFW50_45215 [Streptosporangiaceae bacterium]|nr:hypothetical protein [Streptosporangiaceae bacterium]
MRSSSGCSQAATVAAIAAIPGDAWTALESPQAIWDDQLSCWVSDAEVAQTQYTAFPRRRSPCTSPPG